MAPEVGSVLKEFKEGLWVERRDYFSRKTDVPLGKSGGWDLKPFQYRRSRDRDGDGTLERPGRVCRLMKLLPNR